MKKIFKGVGPFGPQNIHEEVGANLEIIEGDDGKLYQELPDFDSDTWHLGFAPAPNNIVESVLYDIAHGILMKYNIVNILIFAFKTLFNLHKRSGKVEIIDRS